MSQCIFACGSVCFIFWQGYLHSDLNLSKTPLDMTWESFWQSLFRNACVEIYVLDWAKWEGRDGYSGQLVSSKCTAMIQGSLFRATGKRSPSGGGGGGGYIHTVTTVSKGMTKPLAWSLCKY